jgi:predicted TIM-barrel fold metal-dependent hydrolase
VATIQGAINGNLWSDAFFDPLWQELDRLRAPFGFHIAAEGQVKDNLLPRYAGHRRTEVIYNMLGQGGFYAHTTVAELILGGVLERYRNIRPVMMESGASWLPWLLWRMDEKWEAYAPDMDYELSMKPSEYWRSRCYAVIDCGEHVVKYTIAHQGDHNLLVSTDFPHHDSPFPHGIETFVGLEGLTRENKRKILWDNGARLFGLESLAPQPVS